MNEVSELVSGMGWKGDVRITLCYVFDVTKLFCVNKV